jgi:hypothetical protein
MHLLLLMQYLLPQFRLLFSIRETVNRHQCRLFALVM